MKSFELGKLAGRPITGFWLAVLLLAWAPAASILAATPTVVRVVDAVIGPTTSGTVIVEMVASGEESALSFSLVFDPARLTFGNAALGAGASTASLFVNSSQAASGRVGIVVGVSPGQAFPVGQLELLRLTFTAGTVSGPTPLAFGNVPVVREISDRLARPLTATFADGSVLVGNRAPVLNVIPSQTVGEGNTVTFTAVATDPDLPRDTLTFGLGANPPAGATINPTTGVFTWTPSESQGPNTVVITVTVTDNGTPVLSDSENVTITVNEANSSPSITPVGSQTVAEGTALSFTVNANDPDIPANGLTFSLGGGAPPGASISSSGFFSWTPTEAQGPGSYSMTVNVIDNGSPSLSASTTISVTVTENNAAPAMSPIGNQTVTEGQPMSVTASATDADLPSQVLTFTLDPGAPPGMSITPNGAINWTPTEAQGPGTYTVTVRVTDSGGASVTGGFTVTVNEANQPPVFAAIASQTIPEGGTFTAFAAAADPDQPPQTLAFTLEPGAPAGMSISSSSGGINWTPTEAQGPGNYSVTVRVSDGAGGSVTQSFSVTVTEVNSPPTLASIPNQTIKTGETLTVSLSAADTDLPAQELVLSMPFGGPLGASINSATKTFVWTPALNHPAGVESVTIQVTDSVGASALQSFSINVTPSNLAPVLGVIPPQTVNEGQPLTVTASATDPNTGQPLTFSLEPGAPPGVSLDPASGAITWTPTEAQGPGTFTIGVRVSDAGTPPLSDTKSFTVTVNEVNTPPTVQPVPNQTVNEGAPVTVTVSATDSDLPAQTLAFSLEPGAPAGASISATGAFSWTPSEAQGPGSFPITVRVTDSGQPPASQTVSFTVTVNEVNAPPVVQAVPPQTVNEGSPLSFTVTATDADAPAQTLTFSLDAGAPPGASINSASGAFNWTPTELQAPGTFSIVVRVTDNGTPPASGTVTVSVTAVEVNNPPALGSFPPQTIAEGTELTFAASATDADLPPQTITYSVGPGAPPGLTIDSASGQARWTPTEAQGPGSFTAEIRATDNATPPARSTQTVTINVTEVNRPPVLAAVANQNIAQADALALEMKATDDDLPRNTLTFSLEGAPAGATIDPTTGAFTWSPTAAQAPSQNNITVRVTDNGVPPLSDSKSFSVAVRPGINVPPTLSQIGNQTIPENTPSAAIVFTITDPDTPLNTLTVTASSSNPTLVPNANINLGGSGANRTVTIIPAQNQTGTATITVTVKGTTGDEASTTFGVTVNAVAPTIVRQPQNKEALADAPVALDVTAAGSQPLGYQWRRDGADIPGATSSVFSIASAQPENEGSYSVVISNRAGSITSSAARLTVKVALRITKQPVGQVVLAGGNVTFVVTASGRGPLRFQWQFNGTPIAGETNPSLVLNNVDVARAGGYSAEISNADGSVTSAVATLQVNAPPTITQQPQNQSVVQGAGASFSVVATGSPPLRFQWRFNGVDIAGQTGPTLQLANVTVANAGGYAVVVSNPAGAIDSSAATLVVSTPPAITRPPQSLVALAGVNVDFNVAAGGTPPLTYQWQFNGADLPGATSPSLSVASVTPAAEGSYTVIVRNAAGFITSAPAELKINEPVTISQPPQNQTTAVGGTATFGATAAGTPPLKLQWKFNGVDIPGANTATLTIPNVQLANAGSYQLLAANAAGPVLSSSATLTVLLPPTILSQPADQRVAAGASATFSVAAAGAAPLNYQWRFEGADIPGATGPSFSKSGVQIADSGSYNVVVRNPAGAVTSAAAILRIIVPPSIQSQPASQSANLGQSVTFSVAASGDSPLTFQWQKNGGSIPGANSPSLNIPSVQAGDQGSYTVVIENPIGALTSNPAGLGVLLPQTPSGNSAASAPPPIEAAEGTFDGGNNTAGGGLLSRKNAPPSTGEERWFSWKSPSTGIVTFSTVGSTFDTELAVFTGTPGNLKDVGSDDDRGGFFASEVRFNAIQGTTYLVRVKGFGGAAGKIVVGFKLQTTPQKLAEISVQPLSQTVALGAPMTLQVVATGNQLSYQWFANGIAIPGATGPSYTDGSVQENDAVKYTVKVTSDSQGANPLTVESLPAIIQIGADSPAVDKFKNAPRLGGQAQLQSLEREPGKQAGGSVARGYSGAQVFNTFGATKEQGEPNHADIIGGASQWFTYVAPQNGTVRVSTEGSNFDTVLAIYTGPGTDFASLKVEAFDNNSGADGKTSVATVSVKTGTTYYIAVDGINGATGTVKLNYEMGAGPVISTQPLSTAAALGSSAFLFIRTSNPLSSVTTNVPTLRYQWSKEGLPIAGQTSDNLAFPSVQVADAGNYTVVASNFAGSSTSAVARVTINVPLSITTAPQSQTVKPGGPAIFTLSVSGTPPITYQWRRNGIDLAGQTNAALQILSVQPADLGSYTVVAQNPNGAVESPAAILSVNQAPAITIPPFDQVAVLNGTATFLVTATGSPPLSYQWRYNGVDIPGATSETLAVNNVSPANVGNYAVVVSNNADSTVSPSARLTLRIPLSLLEEPQSQTVAVGSSASFSVRAAGVGPFTYQWRKDGAPIAAATAATYTQPNVQAADAGQYTVVVTSGADSVESRPAVLTVSAAPAITQQPSNQVVFAGTNVTFAVTATGTAPLNYQWFKDGVALPGATNSTLVLNNVQPLDGGTYSVTVSNTGGSVSSDLAVLSVQQLVSNVQYDAVAGFQFRLTLPAGRRATVQVSSDLVTWVNFTADPLSGVADIQDSLALGSELRFYRIVVE